MGIDAVSRFTAKTSKAYNSTSDERASQNVLVKGAVLQTRELRPEAYRLQYRELKKSEG